MALMKVDVLLMMIVIIFDCFFFTLFTYVILEINAFIVIYLCCKVVNIFIVELKQKR